MLFLPFLNLKDVNIMSEPLHQASAGTASKTSSAIPYLIAVVVMVLVGMVAVMSVVMLRPEDDNAQLITTIIGFLFPTIGSVLALMKSQETHLTVNSSLSQWKEDFAKLNRAEGAQEAVAVEQARVAVDTDKRAATKAAEALSAAALRPVAAVPVAPVAAAAPATEVGTVSAGTAKPDMAIKSDAMAVDAAGATINIVQPKK